MNIIQYIFNIDPDEKEDRKFREELKKKFSKDTRPIVDYRNPYADTKTWTSGYVTDDAYTNYGSASYMPGLSNFMITNTHPYGINYNNEGYNNSKLGDD